MKKRSRKTFKAAPAAQASSQQVEAFTFGELT